MDDNNSEDRPERRIDYLTDIYVWAGLLLLTALTIAVAGMHIPRYSILLPLLVASCKAGLVLMYFMRLKYEGKLLIGIVSIAVFALTSLIGFTFLDVWYR
ncbi:MAG: cytochrome C oxidase subunit IV family protein [Deltaproteobacteria bacterium]|nr:cytochrome C oxidase subunit IV family protein [Deltaproteobacteria bacterium]